MAFVENSIANRFDNLSTPQDNLHAFKNILGGLSSSSKLKGVFLFAARLDAQENDEFARPLLSLLVDYMDMGCRCYLVFDGPFLSWKDKEELNDLLDATDELARRLDGSEEPQQVFYCGELVVDTSGLLDIKQAARTLWAAWAKSLPGISRAYFAARFACDGNV